MKRLFIYVTVLLLGSLVVGSCTEEKLDPNSVFVDPVKKDGPFDKYLDREYVVPYNIELKYWLEDKEVPVAYQLIPSKLESAKIMAVLIKHLWLDTYAEVSPDGTGFLKQYATRIIQFIGSPGFNTNGTQTLGTAEGGKKMVLYKVNSLDINDPDSYGPEVLLAEKGFFQVIHHEFAHILHQIKNYPTNFQEISITDYVHESWNDSQLSRESLSLGFITPYARANQDEDFVELFSMYVTMTSQAWNSRVASAGTNGSAIINQKLTIVKNYFKASWGMDLDNLRNVVQRRGNEVGKLDFVNLQ